MSQLVKVKRIDGTTVCEIEPRLDGFCLELKQQISDYLGICKCKFRLVAGTHLVRDGLYVRRIMKFIEPDLVLQLIEQPVVLTNVADLHASGVCFKCMREVGVQANEILALPIPVDAAALRRAGFSLEALVRARDLFGLAIHPPVTNRTLFDSQLKAAGFSAHDFAMAGYQAWDLSEEYFRQDEEEWRLRCDGEWEECFAFFTASELRSAGYDALALRRACFSIQDLQEAGFTLQEVTEADRSWALRATRRRLK